MLFEAQRVFQLCLTVLFGDIAEGPGKPQAASLRATKSELRVLHRCHRRRKQSGRFYFPGHAEGQCDTYPEGAGGLVAMREEGTEDAPAFVQADAPSR